MRSDAVQHLALEPIPDRTDLLEIAPPVPVLDERATTLNRIGRTHAIRAPRALIQAHVGADEIPHLLIRRLRQTRRLDIAQPFGSLEHRIVQPPVQRRVRIPFDSGLELLLEIIQLLVHEPQTGHIVQIRGNDLDAHIPHRQPRGYGILAARKRQQHGPAISGQLLAHRQTRTLIADNRGHFGHLLPVMRINRECE